MAQARAVEPLGAHVVPLARVVGPHFVADPEQMFSRDRFHPSSLGYKRTAQALLPRVVAALEVAERRREGARHPRSAGHGRPVTTL